VNVPTAVAAEKNGAAMRLATGAPRPSRCDAGVSPRAGRRTSAADGRHRCPSTRPIAFYTGGRRVGALCGTEPAASWTKSP
jgi:hypothetical protein